ncbi:hypothetical protein Tco_0439150 [Tanacetum coccineum]
MPEDIKVPLILERPFLSTARAKIDVYKKKITLRVGEENIIFKCIKPASSLIRRVYMLSLREIIELDLEARLMGETLVLNRSLDPFLEDYIELNDLNEPFELRRNQGDDLMPTIEKVSNERNYELILEDMDAYRDEGIGDIIIGEPFLREVCSFMLCDLDFEPLSLSLSSMLSYDLESLTNILLLCLILKASNQSLRKSLSLNLQLS